MKSRNIKKFHSFKNIRLSSQSHSLYILKRYRQPRHVTKIHKDLILPYENESTLTTAKLMGVHSAGNVVQSGNELSTTLTVGGARVPLASLGYVYREHSHKASRLCNREQAQC